MLRVSTVIMLCRRSTECQKYTAITVQGNVISVPTSSNFSIIDTATTLIAAPTSMIANIWSQIPGSEALDGEYTGLYAFRQCHLYIVG
jgi:hypothetical protein